MKMIVNNCALRLQNFSLSFAAMLCLLVAPVLAGAQTQTIEAKLPRGIIISAEFHKGIPSLPVVLMLHGFLQTSHSPPISTLAANLASKGYSVLSPTISLGVNRRKQSMDCAAVHTHTVNEDIAEIDYWTNWLIKEGYNKIVIIGFSSTGNFEALQYNLQTSQAAIKKAILVSMIPIYAPNPNPSNLNTFAKTALKSGKQQISSYNLGYCKNNFTSTANTYHSYAQYNDKKMLELIQHSTRPLEVILGSQDTILPGNWANRIRSLQSPTRVTVIENANHFFDGTAEFDLAEEVESILKNISAK